jgi:hypothetical protein
VAVSYAFGTALRRIDYVRVDVRSRPAAAHVVGVAHRLPTEQRVPLSTAASLAAAGLPVVILERRSRPSASHPIEQETVPARNG